VAAGPWRPAVGNSDAHLAGQLGTPQTVVRAATCTSADLVAGIRRGHCWIAASAEVSLQFTVSAGPTVADPGDVLVTGGEPVTVSVAVRGVPAGVIRVHAEQGVVAERMADELTATVSDTGFVWVSVRTARRWRPWRTPSCSSISRRRTPRRPRRGRGPAGSPDLPA
jgi:hypothetical protein